MNNAQAFVRALMAAVVCATLAVWLGYLLANPLNYSEMAAFAILGGLLVSPLLLRWHYQILLLSWNMSAIVFFLPGEPTLGLTMIVLSLGISLLRRAVNKESGFIRVPQLTLPLIFLIVVAIFTAKMTGLGMRSLGGEVYGGKKYVYLLVGILGYFALTAQRIPPERRNLYVGLFFLGAISATVGDLMPYIPKSLYFLYWFFEPNSYYLNGSSGPAGSSSQLDTTRLGGAVAAGTGMFFYMLARYGIRGIFLSGKPWRWVALVLILIYSMFGGFRSFFILFIMIFVVQFFLEGMHKTKLLPIFGCACLLGGVALIPLSSHLPYTFQRALSFLPLNIDSAARADAQASLDWRFEMWQGLWPQVPQYLLLGKGYAISTADYDTEMGGPDAAIRNAFAEDQGLALAGDYHNGPLSVLLPFGIWGAIAFLWFLFAGFRVLYANYRYGDPALRTINTLLLAVFIGRVIFFFTIFGALNADMALFCGLLGLSVSLNGGVCRPSVITPTFVKSEKIPGLGKISPRPVPAFQRRAG